MGIGAMVILVSCSNPSSDRLPECPFKIGDTVTREGVGAVVPERGEGVSGYGDSASASASIQVDTSRDGVVTINTAKNGVSASPEVCQLP